MPDLHAWITQRIARVDATAHAAEGRIDEAMGELYIAEAEAHLELHSPVAVLRRCEADRRILARHRLDPDCYYEPACLGCRTYGDQEMAYTDNLNECPELLDLAYAHGLTDEILATLDQPETPTRPERTDGGRGFQMPTALQEAMVRLAMTSVPPALRGPNWKAQP